MDEPELIALVEDIQEGRDTISVPEELVVERPPDKPIIKTMQTEIQAMTVGQRLKLALKGNRDARTILIRHSSPMVQRFVLSNPRVTEDEVLGLAKNRNVDRDLLEVVCKRKDWLSNYQIRHALALNPKTPMMMAVRFVPTLLPRDLRAIAKSRNVPAAVCGTAKRLVIDRGG
jgi:hypothetical protein